MNREIVSTELLAIQSSYLELLKHLEHNSSDISSQSIVDNILIFWKSNEKFIKYAVSNYFEEETTSVFTAATKINTLQKEQVPFILLNKWHIWDDPTPTYIEILRKIDNDDFATEFKKDILGLIRDNITLLENYIDRIFILPISYLNGMNKEDYQIVDSIFDSLFEYKYRTRDEYKSNNQTIEEISQNLAPGLTSHLIFSVDEDPKSDFVKRYHKYLDENELLTTTLLSDADKFSFIITGFLIQAYKCVNIIAQYKYVPYIRNKTTFNYLMLYFNALNEEGAKSFTRILNKFMVYYFVHNSVDLVRVIDEKQFLTQNENTCVEKIIMEELQDINSEFIKIKFPDFREIILRNLENIKY